MTIYFAQMGDWIKIGYTAAEDPSKRIAQLQTGQPERIILLGTIPGDMDAERELHKEFAEFRGNGEWFRRELEVLHTVNFLIENQHPWYFARSRTRVAQVWLEAFQLPKGVDASAYEDHVEATVSHVISRRISVRRKKHGPDLKWERQFKENVIANWLSAHPYLNAWNALAEVFTTNPFGAYGEIARL